MPELPEVETMRRGIAPVTGCRIQSVERPPCRLKPIVMTPGLAAFRRRAVGRTVQAVERIGKRVALLLDSGDRIVLEPRMTGLVLVADPPDTSHLRLRLRLAGGSTSELLFWDRRGLGLVRLVAPGEFLKRYGPSLVGPDALAVSPQVLRERLGGSRREIKVALLDQRAVAGIGNLYASEILHLARLHPRRPSCSLRREEWLALHAATQSVLQAALKYEGSTLGDGTYRNALNQAGGYQNHHRVYDRAGERCLSCGRSTIARVVQAQRSTFYCPRCQQAPRRRGT